MSARDIIREALIVNAARSVTTKTDAILSALTASGYRILGPGEIDAETLEAAARMAEYEGDTWSGSRDSFVAVQEAAVDRKCKDIASAIRALKDKRDG
ncbi:hypothetical protein [Nitratireductor indicus]|uniref:hypothetical protein n=1 Tax=Nitratireductor indicus TaxID=721133 RepID=UPI002874436B|nr:hypothetical protein [Nitratireductor indicus]MDS1138618.1 hypothetical protein [Nitratireductor indicus]